MNKKTKIFLVISSTSLMTLACIGSIAGFSYAKFSAQKGISQTVGYPGGSKQAIYLDLLAWAQIDSDKGITSKYYMYAFSNTSNEWIYPENKNFKTVSVDGATGYDLKLFYFDNAKYTGFTFMRVDPAASGPSLAVIWDQTRGITFSPNNYNYYKITNTDGDSEFAQQRSSYVAQMIYSSSDGTALTFIDPAST